MRFTDEIGSASLRDIFDEMRYIFVFLRANLTVTVLKDIYEAGFRQGCSSCLLCVTSAGLRSE